MSERRDEKVRRDKGTVRKAQRKGPHKKVKQE